MRAICLGIGLMVAAVVLAGCGEGGDEKGAAPPPSVTESTPTAEAAPSTCTKLARTWAIPAKRLDTSLLLAAMDQVNEQTKAMTDAADQMEVEGCPEALIDSARMGNYEAAVAASLAQICANASDDIITCNPARKKWREKGTGLVEKLGSGAGTY